MSNLVQKDPVHVVEEVDVVPPPHYDETEGPQVLTPDTARQAPKGTPVLWVLIGAMVLMGIGWIVVDLVGY